jgi:uncharacterized membrane protein YgdD (TMEM256/DUF423 family)
VDNRRIITRLVDVISRRYMMGTGCRGGHHLVLLSITAANAPDRGRLLISTLPGRVGIRCLSGQMYELRQTHKKWFRPAIGKFKEYFLPGG